MRKPERRLTKKLTLNSETVRTLTQCELAAVAGGFDSHDPCTARFVGVNDSRATCVAAAVLALPTNTVAGS